MTGRARAKRLAYLDQRFMVAQLNTVRWAEYAMSILQEQLALAKDGQRRQLLAERIRALRAKGIFELAKTERDERTRKALNL